MLSKVVFVPRGQDHIWLVLQTFLDQGKMIFRPARFFGDKFLLGTCVTYWSVMHTKRGAIFSSPLGRENVVFDFGVHIILYARFCQK